MFSGIVEATGRVIAVREEQGNKHFTIEAPFTQELRIDQSIAHNGVCLTVVELEAPHYTVTAIRETLIKSNLGELREGDLVNLERSMRPDALLDGHIVQGHVDQTARCTAITVGTIPSSTTPLPATLRWKKDRSPSTASA